MSAAARIFGFIYVRDEPARDVGTVERAMERLIAAVGLTPARISSTTTQGRLDRKRKYTRDRFVETAGSEDIGAILLSDAVRSQEEMVVGVYLRYFRPFDQRFETPAIHYAIVPATDDAKVRAARAAAVESFLVEVSRNQHPLHGGIGAAVDRNSAFEEITMACPPIFGPDGTPMMDRLTFDSRNREKLWRLARRAYWTTILGPALMGVADAEAARAAGAERVETRGECLVVKVTGDVADSFAPQWNARSARIRQWVWPYTIQNPFDGREIAAALETSK